MQSVPVPEGFTLLLDDAFLVKKKKSIILFETSHKRAEYIRKRKNRFGLGLGSRYS